ncbi:hypothetical protein H310_11278 [Aphanomyces invadans]|uniref:Uncharacterized protein n=1 Tax=Aphanomyces invadans TaxID=157072 RepID=A0A024TP79_9STRA|nr:hypothetical protein H310_11278 [Aphanomyces invadans]ETV95401.1 hypothetical protein H310_11278 [Aphanomyces invadans]|eukprot:XP_008876102.1 hypothetical protein H310_11278 [Aphanomyces invadans]
MADPNERSAVAAAAAAAEDIDMESSTPAGIAERAQRSINPPGVPPSFRRAGRATNIARTMMSRELGHGRRFAFHDEEMWIENESATKHVCEYFDMPPTTRSAISIAFSPDGKTFASTHGDHTVKIVCYSTGRILQTLVGHPRTPWSVKFHPTNPRYVASGCLGYQIRFWDVVTGKCLYEATLRHAIISVSFHPCGNVLGIASGTCVYTWDYQHHPSPRIVMFSNQTLRSVSFLPDPTKILVGEANEKYTRPLGTVPSDLTVTLTLWEYNVAWSTAPEPSSSKAMHSPHVLLTHALLYNDGGFDVSKCGQYLAVCTDFSLWQAEQDMPPPSHVDHPSPFYGQNAHSADPLAPHRVYFVPEWPALNPTTTTARRRAFMTDLASNDAAARRIRQRLAAPPPPPSTTTHPDAIHTRPSLAASTMGHPPVVPSSQHPVIPAPSAPQACRMAHLRPNIASSFNRLSHDQRLTRGRLAVEHQSTWLALLSLAPDKTLGTVVQTALLAETAAGGVTSVKFSPSGAYVLLGYGVRDRIQRINQFPLHRVTRMYRWEDMSLVSHVESDADDVNIALFHPLAGGGFLYGTKQGRVRLCRPWRGAFDDPRNENTLKESLDLHALFYHGAMPTHTPMAPRPGRRNGR